MDKKMVYWPQWIGCYHDDSVVYNDDHEPPKSGWVGSNAVTRETVHSDRH